MGAGRGTKRNETKQRVARRQHRPQRGLCLPFRRGSWKILPQLPWRLTRGSRGAGRRNTNKSTVSFFVPNAQRGVTRTWAATSEVRTYFYDGAWRSFRGLLQAIALPPSPRRRAGATFGGSPRWPSPRPTCSCSARRSRPTSPPAGRGSSASW